MPADACDFGTPDDPPIRWRYPCRNFTLTSGDTDHVSIGAWFACDSCSELVEAERWDELLERVVARAEQRIGSAPVQVRARVHAVIRTHLDAWYAAFREHRDGPRELITDRDRADADALKEELRED